MPLKLHIGCGKRHFPGWVHIDGAKYPHIDSHDITCGRFHERTVDEIYASHLIEYFDREEVVPLLEGWYRVLKFNGRIRLAVPNWQSIVNAYSEKGYTLKNLLGLLYGKMELNGQSIYHKTVYNFTDLSKLLVSIGFKNISTFNWQQTDHAHIDDHSQAYLPHMDKGNGLLMSLNIEAYK